MQTLQGVFQPFRYIALIGLGLIGGSIAKAARKYQLAEYIAAYDADQEALDIAKQKGIIDQQADSAKLVVKQADLVVIATPVNSIEQVLQEIASVIPPEAVVIDTGSVKANIVHAALNLLSLEMAARFVPCHPIAGAEKSGVLAARDDLFRHHKIIITPLENTHPSVLQRVCTFWRMMGTEVLCMSPALHDRVLAMTSHLPHFLAFSLVNSLAEADENLDVFRYAAGGFADFTRIAASDPQMWHDIFLANKVDLIRAIRLFTQGLEKFAEAVENENSTSLLAIMAKARSARQYFGHRLTRTGFMHTQERLDYYIGKSPITGLPVQEHEGTRFEVSGMKLGQADVREEIAEIRRKGVKGTIRVPGDKSISHRAIMLGAISDGITEIHGFLEGEDNLATLQAFRLMGVVIEGPNQAKVSVHGVGLQGLKAPKDELYLGNSGTSMRLLCGLLAGQPFDVLLTGDASLSKRPMARVIQPLRKMGAEIVAREDNFAPLHISGNPRLQGIDYTLPIASAQVKSCLLLAGLYAQGQTCITESGISRDHTERMLQGFGCTTLERHGHSLHISPVSGLTAQKIQVPGDISSAAFFMVLASLLPGSVLSIQQVGVNPTRTGVIDVLQQMGANISLNNLQEVTGESMADIHISAAPLKAVAINADLVPRAIDEFPIIFIAAAFAEGVSVIKGIKELRYKESDRIQVMVKGLTALAIKTREKEDELMIYGAPIADPLYLENTQPVVIDACGDHRIAMAFTMAGFISGRQVIIKDCANVATSFPNFTDLLEQIGLPVAIGRG